jgi:hypothetical protein
MTQHDSQFNLEQSMDALRRKGPLGRALKLTDQITMLAVARAFAAALPCDDRLSLCRSASDVMSGGIEMYIPFIDHFVDRGFLEERRGKLSATDALFAFIDYTAYRVGVALQPLRSLPEGFVAQRVEEALRNGGRRFAVWGINAFAETVWAELTKRNAVPVCFIDRVPELYPNGFCGLPVVHFEAACEKYRDSIDTAIVCSRAGGAAMCAQAEGALRCFPLFTVPAQQPCNHSQASKQLPTVLALSLPKSGTHLLQNFLEHIPEMRFKSAMQILSRPVDKLEQFLNCLGPGEFAMDHIQWSKEAAETLARSNVRVLFLLRDPRDVLVSLMNYYLHHEVNHQLSAWLRKNCTTSAERLDALIRGVPGVFESRCDWIRGYFDWHKEPFVCAVKFMELVGSKGGGSQEALQSALRRISDHIRINLDDRVLNELAAKGYDTSSPTFQKGRVGAWRDLFTENLKDLFKERLGCELIELGYETGYNW